MKIIEAIEASKKLKESAFDDAIICSWLSRLDGKVSEELIKPETPLEPYIYPADLQKELLIPYPYDGAYVHYIEAMVDYTNEEYEKYQNSFAMFNQIFDNYRRQYRRGEMPAAGDLKNVI